MTDKDFDFDSVEEESNEKVAKVTEQKELAEKMKGSAVKMFGDVDLAAVETEGKDFIDIFGADLVVDDFTMQDERLAVLGKAVLESSEGSVRDRLYNYGFELSDVDVIISYVQKYLALTTPVDVGGQYFSGEASELIDKETLNGIEDLFGGGKDDKKANKKTKVAPTKKYANPIEEVFSMLVEGQKLPIIYVQQFVQTEENFNKLLTMRSIKKTEYYVYFDEEGTPPDEVAELKNRYIK